MELDSRKVPELTCKAEFHLYDRPFYVAGHNTLDTFIKQYFMKFHVSELAPTPEDESCFFLYLLFALYINLLME